jgi:sterol desaturase/sphingolipid hydroxylase (fatty acid hydroxylase superfamily)
MKQGISIYEFAKFIFLANIIRYFLLAGFSFIIFYVIFKKKFLLSKIQKKFPKNKDYLREIGYSMLTFSIFTIVGVSIYNPIVRPFTHTYYEVSKFGYFYLGFSFILMVFIHDTYFYWMHRLMHHPKLFKYFHLIHHHSTNPSPWASFSFQPAEAFVEAGIFVIFAFLLPLHVFVLIAFLLFMTTYNVYGHLGWELYPKGFEKSFIGKWINTSISHNLHHQYFKGNYGLYFMFWDRWMGTVSTNYEEKFASIPRISIRENLVRN